jgi:hypothetical protein
MVVSLSRHSVRAKHVAVVDVSWIPAVAFASRGSNIGLPNHTLPPLTGNNSGVMRHVEGDHLVKRSRSAEGRKGGRRSLGGVRAKSWVSLAPQRQSVPPTSSPFARLHSLHCLCYSMRLECHVDPTNNGPMLVYLHPPLIKLISLARKPQHKVLIWLNA